MQNDRLTPIPTSKLRLQNTTAKSLAQLASDASQTLPADANYAVVFLEAACRWTDDGSTPTAAASGGAALAASGSQIYLNSRQQINGFRIIPVTGTNEAQVFFYMQSAR